MEPGRGPEPRPEGSQLLTRQWMHTGRSFPVGTVGSGSPWYFGGGQEKEREELLSNPLFVKLPALHPCLFIKSGRRVVGRPGVGASSPQVTEPLLRLEDAQPQSRSRGT